MYTYSNQENKIEYDYTGVIDLESITPKLRLRGNMDLKRQASAPLYEAIEKFRKKRIVPFDVPGHKRGRGNPELVDLLGERCVGIDVNSMKPLDNLCHPVSVIKEAEELTAEAFGAEHAFSW